jgi:hypothetical protein
VSVVIPCRNGATWLEEFPRSLAASRVEGTTVVPVHDPSSGRSNAIAVAVTKRLSPPLEVYVGRGGRLSLVAPLGG